MSVLKKEICNLYLFKNSPTPIAWIRKDGTFEEVNDAFCRLVGYAHSELENRLKFQEITHPNDLPHDLEMMKKQLRSLDEDGYTMTKRYITKDGKTVWVNLTVFTLRDVVSREIESLLAYATPLPNGGRFKVEQIGDREVHVRPTITLRQFISDNRKVFFMLSVPILLFLIVVIFFLFKILQLMQ